MVIRGIGIDMVTISEVARFIALPNAAYIKHTFTKEEALCSEQSQNQAEYLATRFAAKEAVFKAVAQLTERKGFDLRIVETLNHEDGAPYINRTPELNIVLNDADVDTLHVSITTEGDFATAFVVACKSDLTEKSE